MIDLYIFVICPLIIAIIMYLSSSKYMKYWILPLQACVFTGAFVNFLFVKQHGTLTHNIGGWENFAGISLKADILSSVMVLLTTFLLMMLLIYDFSKNRSDKMFLVVVMMLQGLIIGIFLSNDIFNIFVLIEVATILISIMLMLKKESRSIYDGLLYLLVNIVAMTFFLFGAGFLYKVFGIFDISGIK